MESPVTTSHLPTISGSRIGVTDLFIYEVFIFDYVIHLPVRLVTELY